MRVPNNYFPPVGVSGLYICSDCSYISPNKQAQRQGGYGTRRLALPLAGLMSLKGYALTPQDFSISILVSGPVLHHPDKQYYNIPINQQHECFLHLIVYILPVIHQQSCRWLESSVLEIPHIRVPQIQGFPKHIFGFTEICFKSGFITYFL